MLSGPLYRENTRHSVLSLGTPSGKSEATSHGLCDARPRREEGQMLQWALAFFIIAVVAAIFGFGGIAIAAAGVAKLLFFVFLVLFLVSLLGGLLRRA